MCSANIEMDLGRTCQIQTIVQVYFEWLKMFGHLGKALVTAF